MPSNSSLPESLIRALEDLLVASPPAELKKSLLDVYLDYIALRHDSLPDHFESIACDFSLLIAFLTKVEEEILR